MAKKMQAGKTMGQLLGMMGGGAPPMAKKVAAKKPSPRKASPRKAMKQAPPMPPMGGGMPPMGMM